MPARTWVLCDQETNTCVREINIAPEDVGGAARGYRVQKTTGGCGLSDGVESIHIDTGRCAVVVVPTRGMGLWKAWCDGDAWGWQSPVTGPVHPHFVPLAEPSGLGWLDGFDELLVRCGLESNGAPEFDDAGRLRYPLHGRIANRPAHRVELTIDGDAGLIRLTGVVEEARFHFARLRLTTTYELQVGKAMLSVTDVVENMSGRPAEAQLLYHLNLGAPLLDAGAQVVAPVKKLVPRNAHAAEHLRSWNSYLAPAAGYAEQVYFLELFADPSGKTKTLLKNAHATRALALTHDTNQLPCYSVWKNTAALADGYVTGMEPATNFPNPRSFEGQHGRVVKLAPGAAQRFELQLEFLTEAASIERAVAEIARLQTAPPQVFDQPQPDWCADA